MSPQNSTFCALRCSGCFTGKSVTYSINICSSSEINVRLRRFFARFLRTKPALPISLCLLKISLEKAGEMQKTSQRTGRTEWKHQQTHAKVEISRLKVAHFHLTAANSLVDGTPITEWIVLGDSESLLRFYHNSKKNKQDERKASCVNETSRRNDQPESKFIH